MKYPDGNKVKVGDPIWWNEGECIGRVALILETEEQLNPYGFNSPGIFISNDLSRHYEKGLDLYYDESYFEDDGLGLLENKEWLKILDGYEKIIKKISSPLLNEASFRAEPIYDDKNLVSWRYYITFSVCSVQEL